MTQEYVPSIEMIIDVYASARANAMQIQLSDEWNREHKRIVKQAMGTLAAHDAQIRAEALSHADDSTSDGYHTFAELYQYRMLYNAWAVRAWMQAGFRVIKSHKHYDGSPAFDGFIVQAELPTGQVSNHYSNKYWGLFDVYEVERADEWDRHTPQIAAQRLKDSLRQVSDE